MSIEQGPHAISPDVRAAIAVLVTEHTWLIDHGRADEISALYTEDGKMLGVGPDLVGREAIAVWSEKRAAMRDRTSRHCCTNLRLVPVSEHEVRGTMILTVFRHDGTGSGPALPLLVGDYDDLYRRGADGTWRFAERRITPAFGGG